MLRGDTVDLYSYQGERITVHGAYASPSASSISEDVGTGGKAMDEPRLVDVARIEPARFIDDPTFCDEYLPSSEPNRAYGSDVPECLTAPPVYRAAIGCKTGAPIVVTFELAIEGEVAEGSDFFLSGGRMEVAADAFCSITCEESGSKPGG